MNIKLLILLVVVLILVFLLFNEVNTLKITIDKRLSESNKLIEHITNDIKYTVKKETENYKVYTNEMLTQIRRMNNIEKQTVVMSDHFIETGNDQQQNIAYLSDVNIKQQNDEQICYMSTPSDKYLIKDEKNNVLESIKKTSDINIIHDIKTYTEEPDEVSSSTIEKQITEHDIVVPKQDDGSLITNESAINKLKNIGRYSKQQLITLAINNGINDIEKLTKPAIYNLLKTHKTLVIDQ